MDTNVNALIDPGSHYTGHLRIRVCGICRQDHKILVVRHVNILNQYALWAPPGGGLQFGEKIKDCLVREFKEETGLKVQLGRFLFLQEFLQAPLHALELFFEVKLIDGDLKTGTDPELSSDNQIIQEVAFKSLSELQKDASAELHQIFKNLIDLDDLYIPQNRFLS